MGLAQLEATFDRIVDAFLFFDKDRDGYVNKKEIVEAIGQASPGSRNANTIGLRRFGGGKMPSLMFQVLLTFSFCFFV